jgi:trigger factor
LNGRVQTQVEELADNKVRLTVDVPREDIAHAVDHAASDLAGSLKIPGFRKGKVPIQVLLARIGRERLYAEAVESHIGGWFWNAAATSRIRPVANPEYGYDLPDSAEQGFQFTATVDVQPKPDVADWTQLEVPYAEPDVPQELVDEELDALRAAVAELVPVEDRPALAGDTLVCDLVSEEEERRDYVVQLGEGRLLPQIEESLVGMRSGETKELAVPGPDDEPHQIVVTVKEIKEKLLPPLDDDLARSTTEFDTLAELREDIESRLREQLSAELETQFRAGAADALVAASNVEPSGPLVQARAAELWRGLTRSLEGRGIAVETYLQLSGESAEQLQQKLIDEARRSVSRELVLEAVADRLGIHVTDDELRDFVRGEAEAAGEDADQTIEQIWQSGRHEALREDLRLRRALDRVVAEVKRIPVEVALAREKLWTPEKEKAPGDTKLWTPGSKERT